MFKRLITALIAVLLFIFPAHALDFAKREIIGFSADGNFFAFEQYGSQDGSGFAYSDIFIIDTRTDEWTPGSPYRYLLKDEEETMTLLESIAIARRINRTSAKDALSIISDPGIVAATNMADESVSDRYRIVIEPKSFFLPDNIKRMEFHIEKMNLPPPQTCLDYGLGSNFSGFWLLRTGSANSLITMHKDKNIPKSRKCPLDYAPSDVVMHITGDGKFTVAVLIRMQHLGFEGPDRRFLAVTGSLN